jgi:uncharacterized membrane protein HdeD (DUF308 family)
MNDTTVMTQANTKYMKPFGFIAIVLGVLAMMAPGIAGLKIALILGPLVLIVGIMRIIWAFKSGCVGRGILMFALGGLTIFCGLAMMADPLLTARIMTITLAAYFVVDGISEIAAGFTRIQSGGFLLIIGGIISLALGVMIWRQYPLSGIWATGILVGIKLFFIGIIMVSTSSAAKA